MAVAHTVVGYVQHTGVLYFVDYMRTNQSHLPSLGDENHVVTFQKLNKPCNYTSIDVILSVRSNCYLLTVKLAGTHYYAPDWMIGTYCFCPICLSVLCQWIKRLGACFFVWSLSVCLSVCMFSTLTFAITFEPEIKTSKAEMHLWRHKFCHITNLQSKWQWLSCYGLSLSFYPSSIPEGETFLFRLKSAFFYSSTIQKAETPWLSLRPKSVSLPTYNPKSRDALVETQILRFTHL